MEERVMRAKVRCTDVVKAILANSVPASVCAVHVSFVPVGPKVAYQPGGLDENNTYARFTPSGSLSFQITNENLFDTFEVGQEFYVDFTRAP